MAMEAMERRVSAGGSTCGPPILQAVYWLACDEPAQEVGDGWSKQHQDYHQHDRKQDQNQRDVDQTPSPAFSTRWTHHLLLTISLREILDCPYWRSSNTIGTSATFHPRCWTSNSISIRNE